MTLDSRKLTVVIGPSGCGKTTLMKMINRLERPSSGDIAIDGESIQARDPVKLRRSIGYVIQRIGLIPHMTIAENIAIVPELLHWEKEKIDERVDELLKLVDLAPEVYRKRYPLELSGGQQQRIGVARALASDPNIILMDEPFSALDPISREQLQAELKALQEKIQKTIIFVTHDMDEALDIADNIVLMRAGEIEQMGAPMTLLSEPKNDFVRDFIGQDRIHRRLGLANRQIADFTSYLLSAKISEKTTSISVDASIKEALAQLDQASESTTLAVKENNQVIGYLDYRTLLNIAMVGSGSS